MLTHIPRLNVERMKNKTHLCDDFSLREKALIMFLMKLSLVSSNGSMICQEKYLIIARLWKFFTLSDLILQFRGKNFMIKKKVHAYTKINI